MATPEEKWPDAVLASARQRGDPLADSTMSRIFAGGEVSRVNELLTSLVRNDQVPPQGLDPGIYDYLKATDTVPVLQADLIREGQNLFVSHGNLQLFVLVCASLPECYTMKKGVNVLWLTQRLNEHVLRRLLETAQMVVAVMSPGGLEAGGKGLRVASKVRLMHAAIRHLILRGSPREGAPAPTNLAEVFLNIRWDTEALGYPINQQDMVYTLLTFSYVIPRSLEKLGVVVTPMQKEAFIHTWNVVGGIMGLEKQLLPESYAEAAWLFERIKELEGGESPGGQAMTAAVLSCLRDAIPGHLLATLPVMFIRELLDERTRAWLGIPEAGILGTAAQELLTAQIRGIAWLKRETRDRLILTPLIWNWAAGQIMTYLMNFKQPPGWNRSLFEIPDSITANWKVNPGIDVQPSS